MKKLIDRIKAEFGRHYKFIVPFLKVVSRCTQEEKDADHIVAISKKEPRKFFKAHVYTLPKLIDKIRESSHAELKKDELRELLETFPLLLSNIAMTGEKWYIAKILDHPFDVWMAPERLVKINGKNIDIYRGLHIQTKRLYEHPVRRFTLAEWVTFVGEIFRQKIANVDFGFNGHIHFYNCIPLSETVDIEKLKVLFKRLPIPYNTHVDSISVSMELISSSGDTTIATWYIYPRVYEFVGVLDPDFDRAKQIYMETDIAQMMIAALKKKVVLSKLER